MVDDEGIPLSFHTFLKDTDSRCLWVAPGNRADLRFQDISKYTVLGSKHFVDREETWSKPHLVFFAHKTYPSKRRKPQLTLEVRSATSVTGLAKRRVIAPGKRVFQCKSLKELALDAYSAQQRFTKLTVERQAEANQHLEKENAQLKMIAHQFWNPHLSWIKGKKLNF